jgi:hypothetical protein
MKPQWRKEAPFAHSHYWSKKTCAVIGRQQPLSEPVRRRGAAVFHQDELFFIGSDSARDSRWFSPLSEPVRRKPTIQPDGLTWSYYTPPSGEVVTLDKWHAPLAVPTLLARADEVIE